MNTKTDGISSGLVAVAWSVLNGEHTPLVRLSDAEAIIEKQAERIKELEAQFQQTHEWLCDRNQQIHEQSAALKLAKDAIGEVQDLIGESHGVYGLHLNGDESPWGELEQGDRFERLTLLNEALAAIDALKGE